MIEIVLQARCTGCQSCVSACPTNVFDVTENGTLVIARKADCQTCFMCELYCPSDALYVHPDCDREVPVDADALLAAGKFGEFRRLSGWHEWSGDPRYGNEHWRMGEFFSRAAEQLLAGQKQADNPAGDAGGERRLEPEASTSSGSGSA